MPGLTMGSPASTSTPEETTWPNFGATTKVIVPVSNEYEPEVYRKALAESSAPRRSTAGLSDRPKPEG